MTFTESGLLAGCHRELAASYLFLDTLLAPLAAFSGPYGLLSLASRHSCLSGARFRWPKRRGTLWVGLSPPSCSRWPCFLPYGTYSLGDTSGVLGDIKTLGIRAFGAGKPSRARAYQLLEPSRGPDVALAGLGGPSLCGHGRLRLLDIFNGLSGLDSPRNTRKPSTKARCTHVFVSVSGLDSRRNTHKPSKRARHTHTYTHHAHPGVGAALSGLNDCSSACMRCAPAHVLGPPPHTHAFLRRTFFPLGDTLVVCIRLWKPPRDAEPRARARSLRRVHRHTRSSAWVGLHWYISVSRVSERTGPPYTCVRTWAQVHPLSLGSLRVRARAVSDAVAPHGSLGLCLSEAHAVRVRDSSLAASTYDGRLTDDASLLRLCPLLRPRYSPLHAPRPRKPTVSA
ncbi:hypothetical protein VTO73DRAFT_15597 [Trametes versicolor]